MHVGMFVVDLHLCLIFNASYLFIFFLCGFALITSQLGIGYILVCILYILYASGFSVVCIVVISVVLPHPF